MYTYRMSPDCLDVARTTDTPKRNTMSLTDVLQIYIKKILMSRYIECDCFTVV